MTPRVFIATLGLEPQVVTVTLHLLLNRDVPAYDTAVIITTVPNPDDPRDRMAQSIDTLTAELHKWKAQGRLRQFHFVELRHKDGRPIRDIYDRDDADAVFTVIRSIVREYKHAGALLDVNAAGGRKTMSIYAMTVAQIHFGPGDRLWLLVSAESFMASRALYPQSPFDAQLIAIPVRLARGLQPEDIERKRDFLNTLSDRERQIVERIARYRETNAQVAHALGISEKTVENRLSSSDDPIFAQLRAWLNKADVSRADLIAEFGPYYSAGIAQDE
jgi:CRISPR-associated protein Csx14